MLLAGVAYGQPAAASALGAPATQVLLIERVARLKKGIFILSILAIHPPFADAQHSIPSLESFCLAFGPLPRQQSRHCA